VAVKFLLWSWIPLLSGCGSGEVRVDSDGLSVALSETGLDSGTVDTGPWECQPDHEACDWDSCNEVKKGPQMLPGADCLTCHNEEVMTGTPAPPHGNSPFFMAGTVYDGILGGVARANVLVRVLDQAGIAVEMTTNEWGNFYSSQPLAPPFTAEIWVGKEVLRMETPVESGACNSCHSCDGDAGGKLFAPEPPS
jgi:hypothetical protein